MTLAVAPGDVLVVRDPGNFWAWWIRLGEKLKGYGSTWNHVVIAHHIDKAGTWWGIEGRPNGGIGWRDLHRSGYLTDPATLSNAGQPRTEPQRDLIVDAAEALLHNGQPIGYDWSAIVVDGLQMVDPLYRMRDQWGPGVPTHVVCSSMADWVYEHLGLANPVADRYCTPADWAEFILNGVWAA